MTSELKRRALLAAIGGTALSTAAVGTGWAKDDGPGVTDSEIKLGTTSPYSGPASAYGVYGQAQTAYFNMINDQGGINGRKVKLISLDNGYNPPKAVEQTRKLVEDEKVLFIAGFLGTPPNTRCRNTSTARRCRTCSSPRAPPLQRSQEHAWTVPLYPTYVGQGEIFAIHPHQAPDARIGVL